MKVRDSGMPEQSYWEQFFEPDAMLDALLGPAKIEGDGFEIGCGYGTFTLPAARRTQGVLHAFDIEDEMIQAARQRCGRAGLEPEFHLRDVFEAGTGLPSNRLSFGLVFNILHAAEPLVLLREARRVLRSEGRLAIIHWRSDVATPRGPDLSIRPKPEQVHEWLQTCGFSQVQHVVFDQRNPYHYGVTAQK